MMRNENNLFLKRKLTELAAMLKEAGSGTMASLEKVKARFCLQEGVNSRTADSYIETLGASGLLTITPGGRKWKYDADQEWDLFQVPISNTGTKGVNEEK